MINDDHLFEGIEKSKTLVLPIPKHWFAESKTLILPNPKMWFYQVQIIGFMQYRIAFKVKVKHWNCAHYCSERGARAAIMQAFSMRDFNFKSNSIVIFLYVLENLSSFNQVFFPRCMHFFSQKYAIFLKNMQFFLKNMQFFSKICNFFSKNMHWKMP